MEGFDINKWLNIDDVWDIESIDGRMHKFDEMIAYANDWSSQVSVKLNILKERRLSLEKSN